MSPIETVIKFMDCIGRRDPDGLGELMTEDHVFTDSVGNSVRGRDAMRGAWRGYYAFCPDYWVSHEHLIASGDKVAVFGAAGGTISAGGKLLPENRWRVSAGWLAIVEGSLVREWRVYADNKPVYDTNARL